MNIEKLIEEIEETLNTEDFLFYLTEYPELLNHKKEIIQALVDKATQIIEEMKENTEEREEI